MPEVEDSSGDKRPKALRSWWVVAVVAAATVLLAGCSGDDDTTSTQRESTTIAEPAPPTTTEVPATTTTTEPWQFTTTTLPFAVDDPDATDGDAAPGDFFSRFLIEDGDIGVAFAMLRATSGEERDETLAPHAGRVVDGFMEMVDAIAPAVDLQESMEAEQGDIGAMLAALPAVADSGVRATRIMGDIFGDLDGLCADLIDSNELDEWLREVDEVLAPATRDFIDVVEGIQDATSESYLDYAALEDALEDWVGVQYVTELDDDFPFRSPEDSDLCAERLIVNLSDDDLERLVDVMEEMASFG